MGCSGHRIRSPARPSLGRAMLAGSAAAPCAVLQTGKLSQASLTQPCTLPTGGNSSRLCQSRKGGLYPVPGLEAAGRPGGWRAAWGETAGGLGKTQRWGGGSGGRDPAGPALAARLSCPKRSQGCRDLCWRAGSCPLLWRRICSAAVGAAGEQSPSSPRLQPPGSAARRRRRGGDGGARQLPPRAARWGAQGGPNPAPPVPGVAKLRGCEDTCTGGGARLSRRRPRCHGGSRAVPAPGRFPTPGWARKGRSAPGAAVLRRGKWQGGQAGQAGAGREGRQGRAGSSSRAGDISEPGVNH